MKEKKKVEFEFQEIPLAEARNSVLAGDGNYAGLKQSLLEKLPNLDASKTIAFGIPGKQETAEDIRRGICMSLNVTLKRAGLAWRVTYSGTQKLFICIPKAMAIRGEYKMAKKKEPVLNHVKLAESRRQKEYQAVADLYADGRKFDYIVKHVSLKAGMVKYYITKYRKTLKGAK